MSSRRKILLIDYDPESIENTRGPLVKAGYEVEVASDGIAGVEAFERLKPDLVLIEPMVPKKHGFQVCQEIKSTAAGRDTPVLITTGFYRGRKHRDEARENYGCDDYLEKPIAEELLLSTCGKFFIDTQTPPIPVADEPAAPLSLAPPARQSPVDDSGPALVDRLPEMPIPGEKQPPMLPALDDLTEDEIQVRLDAMIIGDDDRPAADSPPPPDPVVAPEPPAASAVEPPVASAVEPPVASAVEPPVASAVEVEALATSPASEQPIATPTLEAPTVRPADATVESLLARKSFAGNVPVAPSETVAEADSEFLPLVVEETPARSRLPLWIGIAAGVLIVAGITILWMLRDQGSGDPSIEVAAMSTGVPRPSESRTPSRIPPAGLPSEPATGPDAAVEYDAAAETDEGSGELPGNPEAPAVGEAVAAIDPAPPETTQPVTKQSPSSPPVAVVEERQPRRADLPDKPKAAATSAVVTAGATSKTAVEVDDAIDDAVPAPPTSRAEPEPGPVDPQVDPVQETESPAEGAPEGAPEAAATSKPATEQIPPASSPSSPANIDPSPLLVVAPETETARVAPAEPPAPKTRRGDLVDLVELDRVPVAKVKPMPDYPRAAQSMRIEGIVNLRLLVNERGQVDHVQIVSGTKSKQLQRAAADAAEDWVYDPGMKDGVPVKVWVVASVNFKL